METSNASDLLPSVFDVGGINGLFGFEHSINAFSRNDRLSFISKYEWRILSVKNHNINLVAKHTFTVYNIGRCCLVAFWEIGFEQL